MAIKMVYEDQWGGFQMFAFRFTSTFFLAFISLYDITIFPFSNVLLVYPAKFVNFIIQFAADNYFALPYEISLVKNGSGDTLYNYLLILFIIIFSTATSLVWHLLDQRRKNYSELQYWVSLVIRFYLATMLIDYGLAKIFEVQFPHPDLIRLTSRYGDSSPMGLAWTFFGYSSGYNYLIGLAELASCLLLFKRTLVVGSLICLAVTINIMAVNYFFDVPVKILSTALVLMNLFLIAPHISSLSTFFILGRPTSLKIPGSKLFDTKLLYKNRWFFKLLYIIISLSGTISFLVSVQKERAHYSDSSPFYGAYSINSFEWGVEKGNLTGNVLFRKWKELLVESNEKVLVRYLDDEVDYCSFKVDTGKKKIYLTFVYDPHTSNTLYYVIPEADKLILFGELFGNSVRIELSKQRFKLRNENFKWITESPVNY